MEESDQVVAFSDRLDTSRYPEMVQRFKEEVGTKRVIIDLTAATSIDPTFMGELMLFNRRMAKEGRSVVVVAKGEIARRLVIAGVDKRMPVVADPRASKLLA